MKLKRTLYLLLVLLTAQASSAQYHFELPARAAAPEPATAATTDTVNVRVVRVGNLSFNMIRVEGGTFLMGSDDPLDGADTRPVHQVTLSTFYMAETEVVQQLWTSVMGDRYFYFKDPLKPVDTVNWIECQEFIDSLNRLTGLHFRLPTEAEWEYAARGGNKSGGYKYSGSDELAEVAWSLETGTGSPTYVPKQKAPNELGLYDMSGNVMEWCQDVYTPYSAQPQTNPCFTSDQEYPNCVYRGGSWSYHWQACRVFTRYNFSAYHSDYGLGMRLAMDE